MTNRKPPAGPVAVFLFVAGLFVTTVSMAGKATVETLPAKLGKYGVVVMQVGPASLWEDADVRLGTGKKGKVRSGYFVKKLKPGKHSIKTIKAYVGLASDTLATTLLYDSITLNLDFEVQAGKVTDLGLQYFLANPDPDPAKDGPNEYFRLGFSNDGGALAYLNEFHPQTAANLSPTDVVPAPGEYDNAKLPEIRDILFHLYLAKAQRNRKNGIVSVDFESYNPMDISESGFAVGDLGLIAYPGPTGDVVHIDSGTVDRVAQVRFSKASPMFLTRSGRLMKLLDGRLEPVASKPENFRANGGALLDGKLIALTDRRFRFLVSADAGETWSAANLHELDSNLSVRSHFSPGNGRLFATASNRGGFGTKNVAFASIDAATGRVSDLVLPKKIAKNLKSIIDTDAGLFAHTSYPGEPTVLHFKANGSNEWLENEVSKMGCEFSTSGARGNELYATCGPTRSELALVSRDLGKTWFRREQTSAVTDQP